MKKIGLLILFISSAQALDADALQGFVVGQYDLIGKSIGNKNTYYGEMTIKSTDTGFKVTRIINGKTITGKAAIEHATGDKVPVLRVRFIENGKNHEETCLVNSDLDNYARLTCHLYLPSVTTTEPGLEALFIKHDE